MESKSKDFSQWITIITALLSFVSALGVAFIGYQSGTAKLELQSDIEKLGITIRQEELALEQRRFDAEQQKRRDDIVTQYIPKLLSVDQLEKEEALAVLFVLYPNEAGDILSRVAQAVNEKQAVALAPIIVQAIELDEKTGDWTILVFNDPTLDAALAKSATLEKQDYDPVIYYRDDRYITTIGSFPTESEAKRAIITVQFNIQKSAQVVNLNSWCPEPGFEGDYYECQNP